MREQRETVSLKEEDAGRERGEREGEKRTFHCEMRESRTYGV